MRDYYLYALSMQLQELVAELEQLCLSTEPSHYKSTKGQYDSTRRIHKKLQKARDNNDEPLIAEYEKLLISRPSLETLNLECKKQREYIEELANKKVKLQQCIRQVARQITERKAEYARLAAAYSLGVVKLPEKYKDRPVLLKEESPERLDLFFSGSNNPLSRTHGHYIVTREGTIVYRRDPGVRRR